MNEVFHKIAVVISTLMGSSLAFLIALLGVILWFIIGSILDELIKSTKNARNAIVDIEELPRE